MAFSLSALRLPSLPDFIQRIPVPARVRSFMEQIQRGSYLAGVGSAIVIGSAYVAFGQGTAAQATTESVTQVGTETIVSSVKAVGSVTFANEQDMRFNQKGTVTYVNFKAGDTVKKGDVIAELDSSTVQADVRQTQLSIGASALQLQQLEGDKDKQILDAQNAVTNAQNAYIQAQNALAVSQQKLPANLAAAVQAVSEKKSALTNAQLDLAKAKVTEVQNLAMTAQSIRSSSEKLLDSYYNILTRDASARPGAGNYTLSINDHLYNDSVQKERVQNDYFTAVHATEDMRQKYGASLATTSDPTVLIQAIQDAKNAANDVYALGEDTYILLQGAVTDTSIFTASDLNSMRSNVTSNRSSAADLIGQAQTAEANLAAVSSDGGIPSVTLKQKQDAVTSAQNSLDQAQANLTILQTQTPGDLAQQQAAVQKAQADFESQQKQLDSTAMGTDINIRLKQNSIAQQATTLQKTQVNLDDYKLVAPFDGVIRRLDYKVGDNLLDTGDTEQMTLQNPEFLIVTIPLDQVDVVRVKPGMSATIALDAVPGQTFQGSIDSINPTAVVQSGVVSYQVLVKLPTPKDLTILSGMTATVSVEIARKDNVVAVPNLALQHMGNRVTVKRATGETVPVEVGMTDGQYTEITSGLKTGDSIISINIATTTAAGGTNAAAAQQLLRGAGSFGGGATGAGGATRTGRPGG